MTEDRQRPAGDDVPDQSWGQGEGRHEPTIPDEDAEPSKTPPAYAEGTAADVDDPTSLTREDEGMDR